MFKVTFTPLSQRLGRGKYTVHSYTFGLDKVDILSGNGQSAAVAFSWAITNEPSLVRGILNQ